MCLCKVDSTMKDFECLTLMVLNTYFNVWMICHTVFGSCSWHYEVRLSYLFHLQYQAVQVSGMFGFPDTEYGGIFVRWNAGNYYPSIPAKDRIGLRSWLQHATMQSSGRLDHGHESLGVTRAWNFVYGLSKYQLFRKPAPWGLLNVCTFPLFLQEGENKIEYRVWNPFRSKLAAAILGGVDQIYMPPGSKVLYLGAASGTTVSHVSDVVGPVSWWNLLYHFCRNIFIFNIYFFPICAREQIFWYFFSVF